MGKRRAARVGLRGVLWMAGLADFFFFRWVDDLIVNYIMLERICGTCV